MKLRNAIDLVRKNFMAKVYVNMAYWVRRKAINKLNGRYDKQYTRLWNYNQQVRKANLDSTLKLLLLGIGQNMHNKKIKTFQFPLRIHVKRSHTSVIRIYTFSAINLLNAMVAHCNPFK